MSLLLPPRPCSCDISCVLLSYLSLALQSNLSLGTRLSLISVSPLYSFSLLYLSLSLCLHSVLISSSFPSSNPLPPPLLSQRREEMSTPFGQSYKANSPKLLSTKQTPYPLPSPLSPLTSLPVLPSLLSDDWLSVWTERSHASDAGLHLRQVRCHGRTSHCWS
jgi:hypothetical protein